MFIHICYRYIHVISLIDVILYQPGTADAQGLRARHRRRTVGAGGGAAGRGIAAAATTE